MALKACENRIQVKLSNSHTVQGSPKQEIVKYMEQIGADLIILGSHWHHQVSDLRKTTATGLLHKAKCDVLVVQLDSVN